MKNLFAILAMGLLGTTSVCAAMPKENTVYYTELTCNSKQDVFEMKPGSITQQTLAAQKPPLLTSLKEGQLFAVFLNGKLVGEKVFKHTCKLKDGVNVEVDVDYGKPSAWYLLCGKNIPKRYKATYGERNPDCLVFSTGELFITQHGKALAGITNDLTYNRDDASRRHSEINNIIYKDKELSLVSINSESIKQYSLQNLQEKPLLEKQGIKMHIN